jgi:hypothetical protein
MTVDEYLESEENSPVRHEYVNGSIYAMSDVSVAHARSRTPDRRLRWSFGRSGFRSRRRRFTKARCSAAGRLIDRRSGDAPRKFGSICA